jgi:preprotein translocase subunit SecG
MAEESEKRTPAVAPFLISLFNVLIVIASIFLICLVLIQRGKGGGLAGAFGGAGGSSAFGTKAGDIFTRITMITAGVWIVMLMIQVILTNRNTSAWVDDTATTPGVPGPASPGVPGKGGDTEIVPPPPTGVPSPATGKPADVPPVTGSGPSAPVPVSPLPVPKPETTPRS